jgi:hypothetical protein
MPVMSSLRGTQSRTRQTTSAPAATKRRTSQLPTSPVPPVTNVGLSTQKELTIRPFRFPVPEGTTAQLLARNPARFEGEKWPSGRLRPTFLAREIPANVRPTSCI